MGKRRNRRKNFTALGTTPVVGSAYSNLASCHSGPVEVMKIGEATIWAGKWIEMNEDMFWDLRIRLNDWFGVRADQVLVNASPEARAMLLPEVTSVKYPPTLDITWEDFNVPSLDAAWWRALVKSLETMGPANVAIYCQGGHGRTGTALSIIAGLSDMPNESTDPVEFIRARYCEETVESWTQIDYIAAITGQYIESYPTSQINMGQGNFGAAYGAVKEGAQVGYSTTWANPKNVTKITPANTQLGKVFTDPANAEIKTLAAGSSTTAATEETIINVK